MTTRIPITFLQPYVIAGRRYAQSLFADQMIRGLINPPATTDTPQTNYQRAIWMYRTFVGVPFSTELKVEEAAGMHVAHCLQELTDAIAEDEKTKSVLHRVLGTTPSEESPEWMQLAACLVTIEAAGYQMDLAQQLTDGSVTYFSQSVGGPAPTYDIDYFQFAFNPVNEPIYAPVLTRTMQLLRSTELKIDKAEVKDEPVVAEMRLIPPQQQSA